jgi:PAS domain S-box-containing protein
VESLVLFGWWARIETLQSFVPGTALSCPESACAALLVSFSLFSFSRSSRWRLRASVAVALLAAVIALESLAFGAGLTMFHWSALLPPERGLGVISVPTSLGLFLCAISVPLAARESRLSRRLLDAAVLSALALGLLASLAAFLGWQETSAWSAFRTTAGPSGLVLIALGVATAFLRPERGLARSLLDPGPAGLMFRWLLPTFVLLPAGLALLERHAPLPPWLRSAGSAPFVMANIAISAALLAWFARGLRRVSEQRDVAQSSLARSQQDHAALLKERELRYRLLAEASPQIVWVAGAGGEIEYLSSEWERFTGLPPHTGIGWAWDAAVHPRDRERTVRVWSQSVERGESYQNEYRLRRHDGTYRWMLSRAAPIRDEQGKISRWYGGDTDVDELHEAREALRQSEARFRLTLQGGDFIVWTQDLALRYTWVYNAAPGYESERALGKTDLDILKSGDDAQRLTVLKRQVLESGVPFVGEVPLTIARELRHYAMRITPLADAEGEIVGLSGAAYDITTRLRTEEALRKAQRFESIGVLAGGVAHDFNNLLTAIIGNATFALSALPAREESRLTTMLQGIVSAGESAAVLTQQLLAYAGKGRYQVGPADLGELRESLFPLLRASVPRSIACEYEAEEGLPLVEADLRQVQQLLTNLVINAVEAIGDASGRVRLTMRAVELSTQELSRLHLDGEGAREAGAYVEIEVADDGPGMPPSILERAFEPFFSTKFLGRGLGLSAAQGIVRAHRGAIRAASEEGRGTRVSVYLPALAPSIQVSQLAPITHAPPAHAERIGGTVLFVDDEEALRGIAELALTAAGFRVLLAEDGEQALEVVAEERGAIDVIVLDMTMPRLGGVETAERLRSQHVTIPIIASSGYSEAETAFRFGPAAPRVLRKPYRPAELIDKVRSTILAAKGGDRLSATS